MVRGLLAIVGLLVLGLAGWAGWFYFSQGGTVVTVERTDTEAPPPDDWDQVLVDDRLEDKVPAFDPERFDSRLLEDQFQINKSAAVFRIDVPMVTDEPELKRLYPSYAEAIAQVASSSSRDLLPSVNMIDGKAKQFDDGLVTAIDRGVYLGIGEDWPSLVEWTESLLAEVGPSSPAAPFLAGALRTIGIEATVSDQRTADDWLDQFERNQALSKPVGAYTWSSELRGAFRLLRYLQQPLVPGNPEVALALAQALEKSPALRDRYESTLRLFNGLTNPPEGSLSLLDLVGLDAAPKFPLAVFPASGSPETALFQRLFAQGLSPEANLIRELIVRIRSGEIDLTPRPESGWYDHQVHALETFLIPGNGPESERLLLTKAYKKRMLEAFEALITKRRETQIRGLGVAEAAAMAPSQEVRPRLRVEPLPSYYLRTARAYAFLSDVLESILGPEMLAKLHRLTADGPREDDLAAELDRMIALFYGLYLISAEDIGLAVELHPDEPVDVERSRAEALDWLSTIADDPDLAVDTRVAVPVFRDPNRQRQRLWCTLGVRFVKLDVGYAVPPHIRPIEEPALDNDDIEALDANDNTSASEASPNDAETDADMETVEGGWRPLELWETDSSRYLIAVDEFAEVEVGGLTPYTRQEFRDICDVNETKQRIVDALDAR